jgi:hypothetical protein
MHLVNELHTMKQAVKDLTEIVEGLVNGQG